jgi:uncharacterized 2Fe-2S/4Fe-4S cluster protein (DUF4445 family)
MVDMPTSHEIVFQPDGKRGSFSEKTTVLEAARVLGVDINSICGGTGACGKCIVQVISGKLPPSKAVEEKYIGATGLKNGFRLGCLLRIIDDMVITVPKESRTGTQRLQTEGLDTFVELDPMVSRVVDGNSTAILYDGEKIRRLEPEDARILGFAVDIGSTKLAGYLMDLSTGEMIAVSTVMNPQIPYGEDIISRIAVAIQSPEKQDVLHKTLVEGVKHLLHDACVKAGKSPEEVYDIVLVGNTVMQHFVLGTDTYPLSRNPFMPEDMGHRNLKPHVLNLSPNGRVHVPPLIAGFIGADCVAATLATGIHNTIELSFLMDIGTNTEIVVGKRDHMVACSCASGPAFEGAHINHGMRAASGAIEGVWISPESLEPRIKVIDDSRAVGICGSGLIDLLSEMLKTGIMDSSGRIIDRNSNSRIRKQDGVSEYVVAWRRDTGIDSDIVITQLDVRELQKGKAAIFSGSRMLMKKMGVSPGDFKKIYMAGAFGTYINRESALNIGMIPEFSLQDIEQVGNAAGTGARMALLSRKARREAQGIREKTDYIELATSKGYNKEYIDALMFPHMDLNLFPDTVRKLDSTCWVKGRIHTG